jgi:gas vesicle protein
MKNSANIFLGILGAAAAGVIVGMLIAPEKGSDLRKNLKGSAGDLAKRLGKLINQGKEHYEDLKSKALEEADEYKQEATSAYKKAKSTASSN